MRTAPKGRKRQPGLSGDLLSADSTASTLEKQGNGKKAQNGLDEISFGNGNELKSTHSLAEIFLPESPVELTRVWIGIR